MKQDQPPPISEMMPELPQAPPPLGPSPEVRTVLYRAVALGVVIILAMILVIIAAVSIGSGLMAGAGNEAGPSPASVPVTIPAAENTVSLPPTTAPVEILPENLAVAVSVDQKSYGGTITINFLGGAGRSMVKEIDARVTLPDGSVVTGSMDPQTVSPQIVLQGSKGTDQLEVFAQMYSGKVYKILDQKVMYPARF